MKKIHCEEQNRDWGHFSNLPYPTQVYLLQYLIRLWVVVWGKVTGPGHRDYNPDSVPEQDTCFVKKKKKKIEGPIVFIICKVR